MLLVGSYVGLSRQLVSEFPVFLLAWLRFAIAAAAMLPWLRPGAGEAALTGADHTRLFAGSLFGNVGFSVCMLFGVAATSAVAAGVVMATLPPTVALLSFLVLRERIVPRVALAIACAVAGIAVLALPDSPAAVLQGTSAGAGAGAPGWGYALLVGAGFCEATYVVLGARLTRVLAPHRISALINLWGLALMTPLGLWQASSFDFAAIDAGTWALLVYYALAASVVSVWLWMQGLTRVAASEAGVFTVLLPLAAAAVGIGLLGEAAGARHAIALALAVTGLLLATATTPSRGRQAA
jgi:drug/metabolite transporter (DMT)-like permease